MKYFSKILLVLLFLNISKCVNITKTSRYTRMCDYHYKYKLNCSTCKVYDKMVLLVTSYVNNLEQRAAHREALPEKFLKGKGIKRVFLLAEQPPFDRNTPMATIINESNTYDDILQGDFSDEYKNLTVKHIMGLSWASTYCSSARFIIKTDDDSVFNIYAVLYFIQTRSSVEPDNFLVGHIYGGNPHRGEDSKWYVSREEYPEEIYNPYVSGGLYLTTPETAERLVNAAKTIPFFWIDDAFVTGILRKRSGVGISSFAGIVIRVEKQLFYYCLTEMETKNLTCPFSVSENGGIINLFVRFMKSLKRCYRGGCSINPPKHLLKIMIQEEIVGSSFNNLFKPYIRY